MRIRRIRLSIVSSEKSVKRENFLFSGHEKTRGRFNFPGFYSLGLKLEPLHGQRRAENDKKRQERKDNPGRNAGNSPENFLHCIQKGNSRFSQF